MREVVVLRLGHRPERDKRVTTHLGLVARAFGAEGMLLTIRDPQVRESLLRVQREWGGDFFLQEGVSWRREITKWKESGGVVVHLTMYGIPVDRVIPKLQNSRILVVVGSQKVPAEVFQLSDFNVAIGNQPHSEVAALAVFLDRLFGGRQFDRDFPGWKLKVIPSERNKRVTKKE